MSDYISVYDGSMLGLRKFKARLIHENGKTRTWSKSHLEKISLSSANKVNEQYYRVVSISDDLQPGDLIEVYSEQEFSLPFLGIHFSLDEINAAASNISCQFEMSLQDSLIYKIANDSIPPSISTTSETRTYNFTWQHFTPCNDRTIFSKRNSSPAIYAQIINTTDSSPQSVTASWEEFGDTYLVHLQSKIQYDEARPLAEKIIAGKTTNKQKMDAVAAYCSKEIRYEQVYLKNGEIIPNDFQTIIARKYGDCKDYSLAIYTLAGSIGLKPDFVLCYRGRGNEFYPDIPVNQFNHAIVHYQDTGIDYWYDGTNRTGQPGIVDFSLINQPALVIKPDRSYLEQIKELNDSRLIIEGDLKAQQKGLAGKLILTLTSQYAIDFFYYDLFLNDNDFRQYLQDWLSHNINRNIHLTSIKWHSRKNDFVIELECYFPNSIVMINANIYFSLSNILTQMIPQNMSHIDETHLFYNPLYHRVKIDLNFENLVEANQKAGDDENFSRVYRYYLPPGPFSDNDKQDFLNILTTVSENFRKQYKLTGKEIR